MQSVHNLGKKAKKASEQIIKIKCRKCYDRIILCRVDIGENERKIFLMGDDI